MIDINTLIKYAKDIAGKQYKPTNYQVLCFTESKDYKKLKQMTQKPHYRYFL
jgi:hypothetical protein